MRFTYASPRLASLWSVSICFKFLWSGTKERNFVVILGSAFMVVFCSLVRFNNDVSHMFSACFREVTLMASRKFRAIKPEIRIVGIDDGVFVPHTRGWADVVGVVFRGGLWLDGVMKTEVAVDGLDATEKIGEMIKASPHYAQLRVVMLNGITFAGFNIVDIKKLSELTKLPVIAVTREAPDFDDIREALKNLPESEERWKIVKNSQQLVKIRTRRGEEPVFMQIAGISREDAEKIVKESSTRSNVPEPLRVAHIIASGLTKQRVRV